MLRRLADWVEERTGYRHIVRDALDEPIPGGARVRYVFGSCLTATFLLQAITGVLLMTCYSPSATTAWGSVYFITYQVDFGWFVRGMHHFGAQAMIILLVLHLLQVLIAGAYRAPRELNWWFGLGLMAITLGLGLTGYLLPWDQKGYWATKVATNIMANTPVVGPMLQQLVVGGDDYGNQTLTRFYALHVAVLPAMLVALLAIHVALFRRHGITHPRNTRGRLDTFWPKQVFLDASAVALVFGTIATLVWNEQSHGQSIPLDAPADPSPGNYPPRPEWFFLALFQLLKRPEFSGKYEVLGTVVVPGAIVAVLALLPLLDRIIPRRLAHFLACGFVFCIVGGAIYLTKQALDEDTTNPEFLIARQDAQAAALRAKELAREQGIEPEGAGYLLRRDPLTRGRDVLTQNCLMCHYYQGHGQISRLDVRLTANQLAQAESVSEYADLALPGEVRRALSSQQPTLKVTQLREEKAGETLMNYAIVGINDKGDRVVARISPDGLRVRSEIETAQTGADLTHYGSSFWIYGLLTNPSDPRFFGSVHQASGMKRWKKNSKLTHAQLLQISDFFEQYVISTPEDLPATEWVEREDVQKHPAFAHFQEGGECAQCHVDWVYPNQEAPNLYGWGSSWWIRRMIERPGAPHFYGFLEKSEQMPSFASKLTANDRNALIRLLKDDYPGAEQAMQPGSRRPRPISAR